MHSRLVIYQRLAAATEETELAELKLEMLDRFGPLPPEGEMLFLQTALKLWAMRLNIAEIRLGRPGGHFVFRENAAIDPVALTGLLSSQRSRFKMASPIKMRIGLELNSATSRARLCEWLLKELDPEGNSAVSFETLLNDL